MSLSEIKWKIKEAPVSAIIGRYINLIPRGSGQFVALCPFHQDTRPSLNVSDTKGLFKCFVCDEGGDSISFVESYTKLSFIESIHEIGKILGIPTEEILKRDYERDPKFVLAQKLLSKATDLFCQYALKQAPAPYSDFLKQRQIDPETAKRFALGYAPNSDLLIHYLNSIPESADIKRSNLLSLAEEIGLIREALKDRQGKGSLHDTFRERIIFPIWDAFGHVVGFGSRAVFPYQKQKYINSRDSFVFNKRNVLYGLNLAKTAIRDKNQVILVEGYMDMITLYRMGFHNVVAVMGVALGERSITALSALTKNFVLALDSDAAGFAAMQRMAKDLATHKNKIIPKYLSFAPHKDPDDFLLAEGAEGLQERLQKAPLFLSEQIEKIFSSKMVTSDSDLTLRLSVLEEIFEVLKPLGTELLATEKVIEVKERLGIKTESTQILASYRRFVSGTVAGEKISLAPTVITKPAPVLTKLVNIFNEDAAKKERALLKEVLLHPECLQNKELTHLLENVVQDEVKKILLWLKSLYFEIEEKDYVSTVINFVGSEQFSREMRSLVGSILFQYRQDPLDEKVLKRLVRDFKVHSEKKRLTLLKQQLRQLPEDTSDERHQEVVGELVKAQRQLNILKSVRE